MKKLTEQQKVRRQILFNMPYLLLTFLIKEKVLSSYLFTRYNLLFSKSFHNFSLFLTAHQQLIYYIKTRSVCQELFSNSFSEPQSVLNQTFRFCACLSETALIGYQIREQMSSTFFIYFCAAQCLHIVVYLPVPVACPVSRI